MVPVHLRLYLIDIKLHAHSLAYLAPNATEREKRMSSTIESAARHDDEVPEEPVPAMQHLLDNPFLLLFIGIAMPTVLYVIWGVMEIVGIPVAK
jgi:hypothetical protein